MKQVKKTFKVYNFDELKEEVKDKILDKFRYVNVENEMWYEFLVEEFKDKLNKMGVDFQNVYFSLDRDNYIYLDKPQVIDEEKFILSIYNDKGKQAQKILKELEEKNEDDEDGFDFLRIETNYYGGGSAKNYVSCNTEKINEDEYTEFLNDILNDFKKELSNCYEESTEDKAIIDFIEMNEYEFLENGEQF